jgi:hypothetical protein
MNELDKMRQMAGIEVISEAMGSRSMQMAAKVLQMAEAMAYEEGAEAGNVTSDMVAASAKQILGDIENHIMQKLGTDMDTNAQEVAAPQVSTATGMDTGTAAGGDLSSNNLEV